MSFIITSSCISCVDTSCLKVCPMDCIHGPINPKGMGLESIGMSDEDKKGKQL